ncbi:MAG: class I SAM-dependent methyltransferase [Rhodobacteraceae bacterium]|nr:class I SAM-dependent methyltransferase [Paracoccaceae bacterium]
MWNDRFATSKYVFGTDPARFLVEHADYLIKGQSGLAVADGEGRNSVFMAENGVVTTAMDGSENAVAKANALALDRGVALNTNVADILTWDWAENSFDLVVGIFIQFVGPTQRAEIFAGMKRTLKPGGILLLHGYTPEQLALGTGGPPFKENMYTDQILTEAFADFDILDLKSYQREVQEGSAHSGMSALIDLVARKREQKG